MSSVRTENSAAGRLTLWVSATAAETAPLLCLLGVSESTRLGEHTCWQGSLRGHRLWVAVVGVGMDSCRRALTFLLGHLRPARIVVVGVAGGLNPALGAGDVVIADEPISWFCADGAAPAPAALLGAVASPLGERLRLRAELPKAFRLIPGTILSWHEPVLDETLRRYLHLQYGADCVDMETGSAAHVCAEHGVLFQAVRAISDPAGRPLEDLSSEEQATAIWHATAVALKLIAAPSPVPYAEAASKGSGCRTRPYCACQMSVGQR